MKKSLFKLKWLGVLLLWGISLSAFAQQRELTGRVTDSGNGQALPGVGIVVKGSTNGTITDLDGNFKLMVMDNDTVVVSTIGYETQELSAGKYNTLKILMDAANTAIGEVVVIGYGQVRKEDATGSLLSVGTKDFNKGAITSPQELLSGKISGVQITSAGGAPGSGSTIRIRGGSSLAANNDPLIVIDGVPVDNDGVSGMSNPLSTINPNDIETFTVLKDASATAIYGSRASNGVIIITTKRGNKGGMKINYTGNASVGFKTNEIEVFGADEYRKMMTDKYGAGSKAVSMLGSSNTDWQNEIFQTSFGQDHVVSLSDAKFNTPYRVSMGYSDQSGILKTSGMQRFTGSLTANPTFLDDHLKFEINAKGMYIKNRFASTGAIGSALLFDPTQPVNTPNNGYGGYTAWMDLDPVTGAPIKPSSVATTNPLATLNQRNDESDVWRSIGNLKTNYSFHFLPELVATLNLGYDYSFSNGFVKVPVDAAFAYRKAADGSDISGTNNNYSQDKKNQLIDFYLNYSKELTSIKSKIDVMGGYSWQHFYRSDYSYSTSVNGEYTISPSKTSPTENYLVSFFGRLNYSLMDRYLITLTIRQDGTSRFSKENRWGTFPSMALAWRLDQESFLKNSTVVSNLKLRLGYGVTGQQNITNDNYPYLAQYSTSTTTARYLFGNQWTTMSRPKGYDANLKWEETTTSNVGMDFGFLKDRINGSVELYKRDTKDLINVVPTAAGTNFINRLLTNVGNIENKGIEFNLNLRPVVSKDLSWEIGFNFTRNVNEITKLIAVPDPNYQGAPVGPISVGIGNYAKINSVGMPANSFFMYQQVYSKDGRPIENLYVDTDGDGVINVEDLNHYKTSAPDYLMGISSRLQYKNWEFSFSGRASLGNYVYNDYLASNASYQYVYNSTFINNMPRAILKTKFEKQQYLSDYYVEDGSFFRMDNMSLGYNFQGLFNNKANLKLSFTAQNVFIVTNYSGLDPEVFDGVDNNIYPRPTTLIFGINLDF